MLCHNATVTAQAIGAKACIKLGLFQTELTIVLVLGILAVSLSYLFMRSVHQAAPNSQPYAPMHDPR